MNFFLFTFFQNTLVILHYIFNMADFNLDDVKRVKFPPAKAAGGMCVGLATAGGRYCIKCFIVNLLIKYRTFSSTNC